MCVVVNIPLELFDMHGVKDALRHILTKIGQDFMIFYNRVLNEDLSHAFSVITSIVTVRQPEDGHESDRNMSV
jgi:hypothetical protein